MAGLVKVLGRVLILGSIAAGYVATGHANTQVYPGVPHGQALFAAVGAGGDVSNLV
jgi:hypothetical protein